MPLTDAPILPEWNDALILPPTYEEYLKQQNANERNDDNAITEINDELASGGSHDELLTAMILLACQPSVCHSRTRVVQA